ncbi:MAG: 3-methyl-2-oxobutanoate hydroxymethyltransferase [Nitrosopumilus sp.]|nr:3-methyl-2-oxobutanoate hydroxymethyltransferase [Nitrosopumilus sp.]MDA7942442.1 3-methyl-2-oxobutanoate hydroxymethyltransferase [Nitrosopumilus sp.]
MPRAAEIAAMKGSRKIVAVTSYDYPTASICGGAGADVLLVGDSAGMVVLGRRDTLGVTMGEMCIFTGAVARGSKGALVVSDMPFMSYQASVRDAVRNAGRLARAGAGAVKLEGADLAAIRAITAAGIPVMGHIGVQPQSAALGGYAARGTDPGDADLLAGQARGIEEAGAFCIVLERVAGAAAARITGEVGIPTIGIGSGPGCDGQVLVIHDMLGLYPDMRPPFAKIYDDLGARAAGAVSRYAEEVRSGAFPAGEHTVG